MKPTSRAGIGAALALAALACNDGTTGGSPPPPPVVRNQPPEPFTPAGTLELTVNSTAPSLIVSVHAHSPDGHEEHNVPTDTRGFPFTANVTYAAKASMTMEVHVTTTCKGDRTCSTSAVIYDSAKIKPCAQMPFQGGERQFSGTYEYDVKCTHVGSGA